MGISPRTQSGPSTPFAGSSINPIDFSSNGSIVLSIFLSMITSRPEGQSHAFLMAFCFSLGSSDWGICCQMSPPRWQNLAEAHRISASFSFNVGPSISLAILSKGSLSLVSVPIKIHFCMCSIAERLALGLSAAA